MRSPISFFSFLFTTCFSLVSLWMLPIWNNLLYILDLSIDIPDVDFLSFQLFNYCNAVYISDMYNGYTCESLFLKTTIYYSYFMFHFDQFLLVEHSVHDVLPSSIAISRCKYVYFVLSIFCLSYSTHKFHGHHFSFNANLYIWNQIKKINLKWNQLIPRALEMLTKGVIFWPTWKKKES